MNGIIIVYKPVGITSHDVVLRVRHKLGVQQVGHAGTLDPLATGILVILVGKATKLFDKFVAFNKAYDATLTLGIRTDTADIQGKIISQMTYDNIMKEEVIAVFRKFIGDTQQMPPMVSAVKVKGQRLYTLARKGITVKRKPREIHINFLELIEFNLPKVKFSIECSKGTYIRKLAEDIGELLGCGACISQIERTKVGPFRLDAAVTLEELNENHLRAWEEVTNFQN